MPIDSNGVYQISLGNLGQPVGQMTSEMNKYQSAIQGRKGEKDAYQAVKFLERITNGKKIKVKLTKTDPMKFQGATLAAGPHIARFPQTKVHGDLIYDYSAETWFANDIKISYLQAGAKVTDN